MDKYKKDFLKSLQHQLLEQEANDDSNPHFWMIGYHRIEWDCPEEYASGWGVFDGEERIGEVNDEASVLAVLLNPDEYALKESDFLHCDKDIKDIVKTANKALKDAVPPAYKDSVKKLEVHWFGNIPELYTDAIFLTEQSCLDYISQHKDILQCGIRLYSPYPVKMTTKNCPEYEQLCNILKTTNWD